MTNFISIPWLGLLALLVVAFGFSIVVTWAVMSYAKHWRFLDLPSQRRLHTSPTPRVGGIALYFTIVAMLLVLIAVFGLDPKFYSLILGLTVIFGVGFLDDVYQLPPLTKFMGQLLAAGVVIFFGTTISNITNPFGGNILLAPWLDVGLTMLWVGLVINALNWLDGMDGLASGVTAIGSLVIAVLSLYAFINQPQTAMVALVVAGVALGFLVFNWHPAKIFMGDSGSHTLGFMLATLSIVSGGKLATAVLVLGLPLADLAWSSLRRLLKGEKPWSADLGHLHHLFLRRGLSVPQTVLLYYILTMGFGLVALFTSTTSKLIALGCMVLITAGIIWFLVRFSPRRLT